MDGLGWLRLQLEWGADEALADLPVDRRMARPADPAPTTAPTRTWSVPAVAVAGGPVAAARALAAAAHTPGELAAALAQFDGCALRTTATNLVFSDGDPLSRLVLVADVPGPAEDRAGVPFAGPAASFLDRMFASVGLDRSAALALSLLPWRPPGDRKPADGEIQACLPFLLRHLELVAPRRLLVFGSLASRALLPGDTRRARSTWQDLHVPGLPDPVPTLAFPSVLHIQATAAAKREAWAGLVRLRRALDEDGAITIR